MGATTSHAEPWLARELKAVLPLLSNIDGQGPLR